VKVKIIKEGKLPDKTLRGTCGHCGCVVECQEGDPEATTHTDRNDTLHHCLCPTEGCSNTIWLDRKKPKPSDDFWDDPRR
jgi:hypothetical protein